MLESGSAAPAFSVPDHEGTMRSLADYAGKHLVIWFYPVALTGG
jgi:peroxiredoxin Q/BCP